MARQRSAIPIVVAVLAAALFGLLVYGVFAKDSANTLDGAVKDGRRPVAPGATRELPLLHGKGTRSLADLRGQVVVLNFWASWCEPCRAEAPLLERAQGRLRRDRLGTVLGATYNDTVFDSRGFEREFGLSFPSVRDIGTELAEEFGTRSLPETFVIDRKGRIVAISRGQLRAGFLDAAIDRATNRVSQ